MLRFASFLALACVPLPLQAQVADQHPAADWNLPIQAPADAPPDGAGVLWAAGDTYKVAFDRGVAFYPLLGDAYPTNLPLRWESVSLRRGDEAQVLDAAVASAYSASRYSLLHAGFEERYDLRPEGVEQSFHFERLPKGPGDLRIAGRITSPLGAASRDFAVGPIDFLAPDGTPIVRYGAAVAFDAAGRVIDVATRYEEGLLELCVPASWLADASLPITIDPLLSRLTLVSDVQLPGAIDIAWDGENDRRLVAFTRRFSASDWDLYSRVVDDAGSTYYLFFNEISAAVSTAEVSVAYVGGADRWVLAFERIDFTSRTSRVLVHLRDDGPAPAAGTTLQIPAGAGLQQRHPSLGGGRAFGNGGNALLAYQEDATANLSNTDNSRIRAVLVDATSATLGASVPIGYGTAQVDEEYPCVSRSSASSSDPWLVAWQMYNDANANDDWEIYGRLVRPDGSLGARDIIASGQSGRHAIYPKVDGREGRFLVLCGEVDNAQRAHGEKFRYVRAQRIDWELGLSRTSPHNSRTLRSNAAAIYDFGPPSCRPIAFDPFTRSHWGLAWIESDRTLRGARLGFDGGFAEQVPLYSVPFDLVPSASVCFDGSDRSFAFAYPVQAQASPHPIYMQDLGYAAAQSLPYGPSCGGIIDAQCWGALSPTDPLAGSEFFELRLDSGAPLSPSALLVALGSAAIPLGSGCELLLDPASFFVYGTGSTDVLGNFALPAPLVSYPFSSYDLYWQWVQIDRVSGTLQLSNALRTIIQ